MTAQAQNALFKTLEEPAGGNVFFLLTDQPGAMLPTIALPLQKAAVFAGLGGSMRGNSGGKGRGARQGPSGGRLRAGGRGPRPGNRRGRRLSAAAGKGAFFPEGPVRWKGRGGPGPFPLGEGKSAAARAPEWLEILEVVARDLMARENGGTP